MSSPIILVTQDSRGRTCVDWFESQDGYYTGDRMAMLVAGDCLEVKSRNVRPETARQIAYSFMALVDNPRADVAYLATHTIAEPGAPLEPVPEVAA